MTDKVIVRKFNEVFLQVFSDEAGILYELNENFKFKVEGAKYHPKVKAGIWDGFLSLYNLQKKTLYCGLFDELQQFCDTHGYELELEDSAAYGLPVEEDNISKEEIEELIESFNLTQLEKRDYQIDAIHQSLVHRRRTVLSPTGSGKSFIIYTIVRYLLNDDNNVLIIVPNTTLIRQIISDFKEYSANDNFDVDAHTHFIMAGCEKRTKKPLVISTWQSLQEGVNKEWFNRYNAILIDEAHGVRAKEMVNILESCTEVKYRLGFTGSLDNSKTNKLVIKGLLGPIFKVTTSRELMDSGQLSELKIKTIVLDYAKDTKSLVKKFDYQKEVDFLCQHERRNKFIRNLALSLEGNTLILFNFIDKHGDVLYDMLNERIGDRKLYYIHGKVDSEERNEVRAILEQSKNAIVLASVGTMSTGVNIKRLNNLIFASPTKSVIRVLQSLGRGLRTAEGKTHCTLFDIMDRLSNSKTKMNYTYDHGIERLKIYTKERFPYNIVDVKIEE